MPVIGAANAHAPSPAASSCCSAATSSSRRRRRKFGLPEVKRGLFAGGGGVFIGTRLPLAIALELTLTGDPIDADRAYALGLVNAVVPADEVLDAALGVRRAHRRQRPARAWPRPRSSCAWPSSTRPAPTARLARAAAASIFASEDAKEGRDRVRREARARSGRVADRAAPPSAASTAPPEVVAVEDVPSPPLEAGPGAGRRRGRGGELPRRAARGERVPDHGAAAVRPRQRVRRRRRRGRRRRRRTSPSATGSSAPASSARSPRRSCAGAASLTPIPDGVDAGARGRVRRGAPHRLPRAALGGRAPAGRGAGRARRRRRRRPGRGAARRRRSAPRSRRWRRRPRSSTSPASYGATHLIDHRAGDLRQALREALPGRRRRGRRPGGRRPGRARAAVRCTTAAGS